MQGHAWLTAEVDAAALSRLRELASAGTADEVRAFLGSFPPEAPLNGGNGPAALLSS